MRVIRFGIVGVANSLIDFGLFFILASYFHMNIYLANVIAYALAVSNSFLWNKRWTFGTHQTGRKVTHDFFLFTSGNIVGLILSTGMIVITSFILPSWIGKILAIGIGFPWNYWFNKKIVYAEGKRDGGRGEIGEADVINRSADVQRGFEY